MYAVIFCLEGLVKIENHDEGLVKIENHDDHLGIVEPITNKVLVNISSFRMLKLA